MKTVTYWRVFTTAVAVGIASAAIYEGDIAPKSVGLVLATLSVTMVVFAYFFFNFLGEKEDDNDEMADVRLPKDRVRDSQLEVSSYPREKLTDDNPFERPFRTLTEWDTLGDGARFAGLTPNLSGVESAYSKALERAIRNAERLHEEEAAQAKRLVEIITAVNERLLMQGKSVGIRDYLDFVEIPHRDENSMTMLGVSGMEASGMGVNPRIRRRIRRRLRIIMHVSQNETHKRSKKALGKSPVTDTL